MTQTALSTDFIQSFIFEEKDLRGAFVVLEDSFLENKACQQYPQFVEDLLAEFMAASTLLSSTLKFEGRLVLQIRSEGDISLLMAECDHEQHVRAIAQIQDGAVFSDFAAAFSKGTFAITIEPKGKEPYQGIVSLQGGSLAECLKEYFIRSEQLDTQMVFAKAGSKVAGFLIQQLPAHKLLDKQLRSEQWEEIAAYVNTLTQDDMLNLESEELLYRLFHQEKIRLFDSSPVKFRCSCSKEKMDSALRSLGVDELKAMLDEQKTIDMACDFCGNAYQYDGQAVLDLFDRSGSDDAVH